MASQSIIGVYSTGKVVLVLTRGQLKGSGKEREEREWKVRKWKRTEWNKMKRK
jgi:hypothetical protein